MRIKFTIRNADNDENAIIMSHRWNINAWHEYRQYFKVIGYDISYDDVIIRPSRLYLNNIYKFNYHNYTTYNYITCYDIRRACYISINSYENDEQSTIIFYIGNVREFKANAEHYNIGLTLIKLYIECVDQYLNRVKELALKRMQTQQVI